MTRAVFLGTPAAAVPSLAALAGVADVAAVITQPDRPRGRSGAPVPPPVKTAAGEWGFLVSQPATGDDLAASLASAAAEIAVVVAYGRILRPNHLGLVPAGFLNVHFSLLPRWRGAAPVERALQAGDDKTGATIMLIDEGLDTGPLLARRSTPIDADATGGSLTAHLAALGAGLLAETLPEYLAGKITPQPQNDRAASLAPKIQKAEAALSTTSDAVRLLRTIRAFTPRPGAWIEVEGKRLRIIAAAPARATVVAPGRLEAVGSRLLLGAADEPIELLTVQPEGKAAMTGIAWSNGRRGRPATVS
jgi:methionyl-tRNA formyltransferase